MVESKPKLISLRFSLSCAFVSIVLLTSILFGVVTYPNIRSFIRDGIRERLADAAGIAALQIDGNRHSLLKTKKDESAPVYFEIQKKLRNIRDRGTGMRFVYTLRKNATGEYLFIVDAEEKESDRSHIGDIYETLTVSRAAAFTAPYKVHVEKEFYRDKWGVWLTSYAPIFNKDGTFEAVLAIDMSAEKVLAQERQYLMRFIAVVVAVCFLVMVISLMISKRISQPMILLEQDMARMQRFQLGDDVQINSRIVEIINMGKAVNNMKNGLRSFKKYVPAELVSELITLRKEAVLGSEKCKLTIFFCDIVNFTTLSESTAPEELASLMGIYFDGMTEIIMKHQGTVDKYIGDSIMAFWGAPHMCSDQAVRACNAALDCYKFGEKMAQEWEAKGMKGLYTRFGVNTGEAVVGNFGYEERLNYTAMGDNVNLASRLEGLNKQYGTSIIISESTYLEARHKVDARMLDRAVVKGKSIGVTVYELLNKKDEISDDERKCIDGYNKGMEMFLSGNLQESGAHFRALSEEHTNSEHVKTMLERIKLALEKEPPSS
jgi:class 3 adenylate cyclase